MSETQNYIESINARLRHAEEQATTNDDFFYCGYLMGHVSLLSTAEYASTADFNAAVNAALSKAFNEENLSDEDKQGIMGLWNLLSDAFAE